jgi:hypothetical protein
VRGGAGLLVITLLRAGKSGRLRCSPPSRWVCRQHDVRRGIADGAGHHADHAGGVRAAVTWVADQPCDIYSGDRAGGAGMGDVTEYSGRPRPLRDYDLYKQRDEPTSIGNGWNLKVAGVLAEAPVIGPAPVDARAVRKVSSSRIVGDKVFASEPSSAIRITRRSMSRFSGVRLASSSCMRWRVSFLFSRRGPDGWIQTRSWCRTFHLAVNCIFDVHGLMYAGVGVAGGTLLDDRLRAAAAMPEGAARP